MIFRLNLFSSNDVFDPIPLAIIDANSNIVDSNEAFKKYVNPNGYSKFKDLFQNIRTIDNVLQADNNGRSWLILYKQYRSKYKVWCTLKMDESPSIWSTIPNPMLLIRSDGQVKYMNKSAEDYFYFIKINDSISKYYSTLINSNLEDGASYNLIYKGQLSKVQIYKHNQNLWLLMVKSSEDLAKIEEESKEASHLKAMGQIATSVVHDFRNILSAISGYCELALESTSLEVTKEYISSLLKTTNNATNMVKELLRFAKSNSTDKLICPGEIILNLSQIINKMCGSAIKVIYEINEKIALTTFSQSDFERIILNIVVNAKDSIKSFGKIHINLYKRYFESAWTINGCFLRKGFYLVLRISDNGCGISYENQGKIFTPFFTTKKHGNGLGLSTILSILKDFGAGINILSTPNTGTCVLVYMPIVEGTNRDLKLKIESVKKEKKLIQAKIVLVEDNEDVSRVCQTALERDGYKVFSYQDAESALEFLNQNECDLLVTDANLPGKSGSELAGEVKSKVSRILVISGYDKSIICNKFPPNTHFLSKPIPLLKFRETVYKILADE